MGTKSGLEQRLKSGLEQRLIDIERRMDEKAMDSLERRTRDMFSRFESKFETHMELLFEHKGIIDGNAKSISALLKIGNERADWMYESNTLLLARIVALEEGLKKHEDRINYLTRYADHWDAIGKKPSTVDQSPGPVYVTVRIDDTADIADIHDSVGYRAVIGHVDNRWTGTVERVSDSLLDDTVDCSGHDCYICKHYADACKPDSVFEPVKGKNVVIFRNELYLGNPGHGYIADISDARKFPSRPDAWIYARSMGIIDDVSFKFVGDDVVDAVDEFGPDHEVGDLVTFDGSDRWMVIKRDQLSIDIVCIDSDILNKGIVKLSVRCDMYMIVAKADRWTPFTVS